MRGRILASISFTHCTALETGARFTISSAILHACTPLSTPTRACKRRRDQAPLHQIWQVSVSKVRQRHAKLVKHGGAVASSQDAVVDSPCGQPVFHRDTCSSRLNQRPGIQHPLGTLELFQKVVAFQRAGYLQHETMMPQECISAGAPRLGVVDDMH